jgi:hypothetical protein
MVTKMKIEEVERIARDIMETKGSHSPQIILDTGNGYEIAVLLFEDNEQKEKMCDSMRGMINTRNISRYFFITEGWVGKNLNVMPSKDPEKRECLIVMEFRKDLKNKTVFNMFTHDGKKIVWGERTFTDSSVESYSTWNFFLEDVMGERMAKARIDDFHAKFTKEKLDKIVAEAVIKFKKDTGHDISEEKAKGIILKMIGMGSIIKVHGEEIK